MDKKGFTLVEVIVVLVILAILAAVLIPTLTG
ncbi:MAG: prepilin-type N-terminal cleavage/methylation domain-containing protein, partial [Clostridiales bacterium]